MYVVKDNAFVSFVFQVLYTYGKKEAVVIMAANMPTISKIFMFIFLYYSYEINIYI